MLRDVRSMTPDQARALERSTWSEDEFTCRSLEVLRGYGCRPSNSSE